MAFDPRVDLALLHDYWADDPALSGVAHSGVFQTVPDGGADADDLVGSASNTFQMLRGQINGRSALHLFTGSGEAVFSAATPQPTDIFLVGRFDASAFSFSLDLIKLPSAGTGCRIGWSVAGATTWEIAAGATASSPDDNRVFNNAVQVIHVRLNGASTEIRVNGAYYYAGNAGTDEIDGFIIDTQFVDFARLLYTDGLLTDNEVGQLLEYFNAQYAKPDWAMTLRSVALVAPSATPADDDPEAMLAYAIRQRGHTVDLFASGSLSYAAVATYDAVVYAGNYADRAANGPIIRQLIDAGVPCWISLREPGMAGTVSDTVAASCDLVDQVRTGAGFAWGNVQSEASHDITDFLGVPPVVYSHSGGGEYGYLDAADTAVGTLLGTLSAREVLYAIDAGTADLSAVNLAAPIVLSGFDMVAMTAYLSSLGEPMFQHEIDWLLGTLSPPVVPSVASGLQLLTPRFGEIIDPDAGDVTFTWTDRAGRTASIYVTTDITAASPVFVLVGSTALGVTTLAEDMSDAATWPRGIWYAWRIVWDDAVVWTHPGFKLISGVAAGTYGSFAVTDPNGVRHVFIPWDPTAVAGEGAQAASYLWDQTDSFWKPGGAHHEYNGLSASAFTGFQDPALQSPPNLPTGYKHYEISAYVRVGALSTPYVAQSTKYWAAEGQGGGVALYAAGTDTNSRGIMAGLYLATIYPLQPCPDEGQATTLYFGVSTRDAPGVIPAPVVPFSLHPYAWPSPCAINDYLIPIRLVVFQVSPMLARYKAGLAGFDGSTYWLDQGSVDFDFSSAGDAAGWALFKVFGNQDTGGFRDMYSLSVSASDSTTPLTPPSDDEPSRPCVLELTVYEADRTMIAWQATNDPLDDPDVQILMEPDNYGAQVVDFLNGSASLATVTVSMIDPPTIAGDQDSGIIAGRLADVITKVGAIRGRRGRFRRFISPSQGWVTIVDGDCLEPFLNDSRAGFRFAIRDTRESERKTRAFQKGETTCLLPRGVLRQGVGPIALGTTIPNVEHSPLLAQFGTQGVFPFNGYFDLQPNYWSGGNPTTHRVVILEAAEAAGEGVLVDQSIVIFFLRHEFRNCVLWWRPVGGGTNDWTKIRPYVHTNAASTVTPELNLFDVVEATYQGETVRAVQGVRCQYPAFAPLPNIGDTVELLVQYVGPTTEDLPFHWEGSLGDFLIAAYDGEFSPRIADPAFLSDEYSAGIIVPTGIRYDATAFTPLTETVLLRVTKPADDLRDWLEKHAYAPSGWAPALDLDGRVSPLHRRFPTSPAGLLMIDNSIAKAEAGWAHGTTIINLLEYNYSRLFASPVDDNGLPIGAVDGIVEQEVQRWYVAAGGNLPVQMSGPDFLSQVSESIATFGERRHTIEAVAFSAAQAIGIPFDGTLEQGSLLAADAAATILPRYAFGTPVVDVPVRRDPTATQRAGNWVGLDLSWMPEYRTGRRGLQRYAQIFELPDLNCAWRRFRMELGEALTLRVYSGHSGNGSGGTAPYTSVPAGTYLYSGHSGGGAGGSAPYSSGPPAFHPSDITGLLLLCESPSMEGTYADTDPISQWDDESGNTNHLTQGNASFRPTFEADAGLGWPAVRTSNAARQWLEIANIFGAAAEIFMVLQNDNCPAASSSGNNNASWHLGNTSTTVYCWIDSNLYENFGTNNRLIYASPGGLTAVHTFGSAVENNDKVNYHDGSVAASRIGSNTIAWPATLQFGCGNTADWWPGRIYAIVAYDHVLMSDERADVVAYLSKYQSARP